MSKARRTVDVFEGLGFSESESANLQLRSAMMTSLIDKIEKDGLTEAEAARRMRITQLRVCDLMRGKLHLFSIDTLVELLSAMGLRAELKIREAPRDRKRRASTKELLAIARRASKGVVGPHQDHAEFLYNEHGLPK